MRNEKPWWEKVADFNDVDQQDFLKGVFQGRTTFRPKQAQARLLGLGAGFRAREYANPEPWTGKPKNVND